jgi:hypothetical protein
MTHVSTDKFRFRSGGAQFAYKLGTDFLLRPETTTRAPSFA